MVVILSEPWGDSIGVKLRVGHFPSPYKKGGIERDGDRRCLKGPGVLEHELR